MRHGDTRARRRRLRERISSVIIVPHHCRRRHCRRHLIDMRVRRVVTLAWTARSIHLHVHVLCVC